MESPSAERPQRQPQMILDSLLHPPFSVNPDRRHPRQIHVSHNQFRRDLKRRTIEAKAAKTRLLYNAKTRPPSTMSDCRDDDLYSFECKLLKIRWNKMGEQSRRTNTFINSLKKQIAVGGLNSLEPAFYAFEKISVETRVPKSLPSKLPDQDNQHATIILKKSGLISSFGKQRVYHVDIKKLRPRRWLNDELINFYGVMIQARSEGDKTLPRIRYFSTFFWKQLNEYGYKEGRLNKWTRKFDLFSHDAILIAVNHDNLHWTTASINFRRKRFESYDSLFGYDKKVLPLLRVYINEESMEKKKQPFDFTGWIDWVPEDAPRQKNDFDCGVFTCHAMEALSRGEYHFPFSQKDMPYLRRRMILEIGNAQLRRGFYE